MSEIARIHFITDPYFSLPHQKQAEEACVAGINWVQLRVKDQPLEVIREIAGQTKVICQRFKAKLIMNDYPEIAAEIKADGVHLGKTDMDPNEARIIVGNEMIIGGTANTFEDIEYLAESKVDYIGLGPFRFTSTKKNLSPVLGLKGYEEIIAECKSKGIDIPIIAIGGIQPTDVTELANKGIFGIAVSSAVNRAYDKQKFIKSFSEAINHSTFTSTI